MTERRQSLHIVIGMPGAGKTTYLNRLLANRIIDCYFDDYQKGAPADDRANPLKSPSYPALRKAMDAEKNTGITDVRYCIPNEELLITEVMRSEFPEAEVVLTYFANNPEACRYNVRLRNRPGHADIELQTIDRLTVQYIPPPNQFIPVIMGKAGLSAEAPA